MEAAELKDKILNLSIWKKNGQRAPQQPFIDPPGTCSAPANVVSSQGKSKACVATFIERKTRHYLALKMPDRIAHSMEVAVGVMVSQYPQEAFQTATTDRGKEFACYTAFEAVHDVQVYLQTRIPRGNGGRTRTQTACSGSSSRRAMTLPR